MEIISCYGLLALVNWLQKIVVTWSKLWRNISVESLTEKVNGQKLENISPKRLVGPTQAQATPHLCPVRTGTGGQAARASVWWSPFPLH